MSAFKTPEQYRQSVDASSTQSSPLTCSNCGKLGLCVNGQYYSHCKDCYRGDKYLVCGICSKPFANAAATAKGFQKGRKEHLKQEGHEVFGETMVPISVVVERDLRVVSLRV